MENCRQASVFLPPAAMNAKTHYRINLNMRDYSIIDPIVKRLAKGYEIRIVDFNRASSKNIEIKELKRQLR